MPLSHKLTTVVSPYFRLPIIQGGTFSFLVPTIAIMSQGKWVCEYAEIRKTSKTINTDDPDDTVAFSFKRSTFVGSARSFVFFHPRHNGNDLRLQRIFYPRFYPLQLFSYLNS